MSDERGMTVNLKPHTNACSCPTCVAALRARLAEGIKVQARQAIEIERLDGQLHSTQLYIRDLEDAARAVLDLCGDATSTGTVLCRGCQREAPTAPQWWIHIQHGNLCEVRRLADALGEK